MRDYVYHLRKRALPVTIYGPENYILTPLLKQLDHAVAAVLEHLTDVTGGMEGATMTYAILADTAMRLPGGVFHGWEGESSALEHARDALHFGSPSAQTGAPTSSSA